MTNVALVVLDTLRKDAFDRYFDWLPGRRFERAFSTANWTVPAHASLFTGKYASEAGVHAKNTYMDYDTVLAEQLTETGYTTRAFSVNTNITRHFDFDRGFADFRTPNPFGLNDDDQFDWRTYARKTDATGIRKYLQAIPEIVAADVKTLSSFVTGFEMKISENHTGVEYGGTLEALEEVQTIDFGEQEFLFLNVMEAHEPYRVPDGYKNVEKPDMTDAIGDLQLGSPNGEQTQNAYDDCAKYLSNIYQELFSFLNDNFDYIITLSDHGEMLGEHDAWGHEYGVYEELTHIPLCISGDGRDGICTETINLIDVYETVLDIAGIEHSEGEGQTLLGEVEGRECVTEYLGLTPWSVEKLETDGDRDEQEQYEKERRGYATGEYYAYETIHGFEETGTTEVDSPKDRLASLVSELNVRDVTTAEVPDEIKDRLADLGYA